MALISDLQKRWISKQGDPSKIRAGIVRDTIMPVTAELWQRHNEFFRSLIEYKYALSDPLQSPPRYS